MIIYPAIDLKDGACVRLLKGDFGTAHRVAEDPVETALSFVEQGARFIHMVDLDGALRGKGKNRDAVARVVKAVEGRAQVELGGGIRSLEDMEAAFSLGVWRVVLGSVAVQEPEIMALAAGRYGARVAVGVDAQDGEVMTSGWTRGSGVDFLDFSRRAEASGVGTLIFTDIDTDGTLQGPSFARLEALKQAVSCRVTASGGVSSLEDIVKLRDMGLDGAIVGKAYYTGAVDLREAVREGGHQCLPNE